MLIVIAECLGTSFDREFIRDLEYGDRLIVEEIIDDCFICTDKIAFAFRRVGPGECAMFASDLIHEYVKCCQSDELEEVAVAVDFRLKRLNT